MKKLYIKKRYRKALETTFDFRVTNRGKPYQQFYKEFPEEDGLVFGLVVYCDKSYEVAFTINQTALQNLQPESANDANDETHDYYRAQLVDDLAQAEILNSEGFADLLPLLTAKKSKRK